MKQVISIPKRPFEQDFAKQGIFRKRKRETERQRDREGQRETKTERQRERAQVLFDIER